MRDYSVLDKLEEGVQIIDPDMRYVYLNQQLLNEINLDSRDIIGQKMETKFPGIEDSDVYQKIKACIRDGLSSTVINEFRFPDGRLTFHELKIEAIDEGAIIFSRDITKTRKGMLLLQETNKQLELFVHMAAHDMREPIRRLSILSEELLLDHGDNLPTAAKKICTSLYQQALGLDQLLNNLRTLSSIGAAESKLETAVVSDIVKGCMNEMALSQSDLPSIDYPKNDKPIACYPSLVKMLIHNLIDNALYHGQGEWSLSLSVDAEQATPIYCFANKSNQPTMTDDLFLPFVKDEQSEGRGLGLAICKKVTNLHQGKIWSEYKDDQFRVYFSLGNPAASNME